MNKPHLISKFCSKLEPLTSTNTTKYPSIQKKRQRLLNINQFQCNFNIFQNHDLWRGNNEYPEKTGTRMLYCPSSSTIGMKRYQKLLEQHMERMSHFLYWYPEHNLGLLSNDNFSSLTWSCSHSAHEGINGRAGTKALSKCIGHPARHLRIIT